MTNVNGINPSLAPRPIEPTGPVAPSNPVTSLGGISDVVEISTARALAAKIQQVPQVRAELVARVKAEIEAGTYETSERLEIAVNRLVDENFADLL